MNLTPVATCAVESLQVSQPYDAANASTDRVFFHLKVASLATVPVGTWPIHFCGPSLPCANPIAGRSATCKYCDDGPPGRRSDPKGRLLPRIGVEPLENPGSVSATGVFS